MIFCFAIEFLQLYDAMQILEIRGTTLRHSVLGQGFLWSDFGYYILGVVMAFGMDFNLITKFSHLLPSSINNVNNFP